MLSCWSDVVAKLVNGEQNLDVRDKRKGVLMGFPVPEELKLFLLECSNVKMSVSLGKMRISN